MTASKPDLAHAIRVFVEGFSLGKSRTHPYEAVQFGDVWAMRDLPRRNPRDYRKEEWIAWKTEPAEVDALARKETRGRFFIGSVTDTDAEQLERKTAYKRLGYRLLATEPFFEHDLKRIPRAESPADIVPVTTPGLARELATWTRSRPIPADQLGGDAPFRQYVARVAGQVVGRVRSIDAAGSTWCSDLHVHEEARRKGIGRALLARMLTDDRRRGARSSVLLSSHTGALVYPRVGYRQLGVLSIFAPRR